MDKTRTIDNLEYNFEKIIKNIKKNFLSSKWIDNWPVDR